MASHESGRPTPLPVSSRASDAEKHLHSLLQRIGVVGKPTFVPFRTKSDDGTVAYTQWPVQFLWETLDVLYSAGDIFYDVVFGARHAWRGEALCTEFWEALEHSTQKHHMNTDPECRPLRSITVPLFFHSDGGEVFRDRSYEIYHSSTAFSRDVDPRDAKFYQSMFDEDEVCPETEDDMATYVEASRKVLESGCWPTQSQWPWPLDAKRLALAGKPFAGGWRFTFGGWQGDLKDKVRTHRFQRNYQSNFMCERCLCCKHLREGNPYDFSVLANWLKMLVTHAAYLRSNEPKSPWIRVRSWTIFRNRDDLLHMEFQGFIRDVAAQLIWDLAWDMSFNTRPTWVCHGNSMEACSFMSVGCLPAHHKNHSSRI